MEPFATAMSELCLKDMFPFGFDSYTLYGLHREERKLKPEQEGEEEGQDGEAVDGSCGESR